MSEPFFRQLVTQTELEEMYEIFSHREDATEKATAIRLARFIEARIVERASGRIIELENALKERKSNK